MNALFRHLSDGAQRYRRRALILVAGGAASFPGAAAAAAAENTTDPFSAGYLLQLVAGLLLVLCLILAFAWLLKKSGRFGGTGRGPVKVLGGLSLGARERLVLVQVGEQQLLLGVAPGRVQTLYVLPEAVAPDPQASSGNTFDGVLSRWTESRGRP